jgi:hypothetical protein
VVRVVSNVERIVVCFFSRIGLERAAELRPRVRTMLLVNFILAEMLEV